MERNTRWTSCCHTCIYTLGAQWWRGTDTKPASGVHGRNWLQEQWYRCHWGHQPVCMSHVPHMNESRHTYVGVMSHITPRVTVSLLWCHPSVCMSHDACCVRRWVMAHMDVWVVSHTHECESLHTYEPVMSHTCMRLWDLYENSVWDLYETLGTKSVSDLRYVTHMNASRHKHDCYTNGFVRVKRHATHRGE